MAEVPTVLPGYAEGLANVKGNPVGDLTGQRLDYWRNIIRPAMAQHLGYKGPFGTGEWQNFLAQRNVAPQADFDALRNSILTGTPVTSSSSNLNSWFGNHLPGYLKQLPFSPTPMEEVIRPPGVHGPLNPRGGKGFA